MVAHIVFIFEGQALAELQIALKNLFCCVCSLILFVFATENIGKSSLKATIVDREYLTEYGINSLENNLNLLPCLCYMTISVPW